MKVLMIEHFLPESIYTRELCDELARYCDITLLTKRNYHPSPDSRWKAKPCLYYPDLPNKAQSLLYILLGWLHTCWELLFGGYDVVHVHTFKIQAVEMALYRLLAKGRLVHTAHNVLPHEAKKADVQQFKRFYDACSLLIVHNEASRTDLVQAYGMAEKVRVMPHGAYTRQPRVSLSRSHSAEVTELLQFGMLRHYKGVDILLNALRLLDEPTRKRLHVTIAGKQYSSLDREDYAGMIADFGLEDTVTLLSRYIKEDELDELFQKADACVFPYRQIYGSGALLMAYSYEKPVIASRIPAFVEETAGGKTGLLFESESPAALAAALRAFLDLDESGRKAAQAEIRRLVAEKYCWAVSARILADCYRELVSPTA